MNIKFSYTNKNGKKEYLRYYDIAYLEADYKLFDDYKLGDVLELILEPVKYSDLDKENEALKKAMKHKDKVILLSRAINKVEMSIRNADSFLYNNEDVSKDMREKIQSLINKLEKQVEKVKKYEDNMKKEGEIIFQNLGWNRSFSLYF